jgi:uncharacterized membrane protein
MDHKAFEKEMTDAVNRNADEKRHGTGTAESTASVNQKLFTKTDSTILKRGLKRVGVSLLTTAMFAVSVLGLIVTAITPGYLAVFLFLVSIVAMLAAFILLYAQGINRRIHAESQGDDE